MVLFAGCKLTLHGPDGQRRDDGHVYEQRSARSFLEQHSHGVGDHLRVDRLPHGRLFVRDRVVGDQHGAQEQCQTVERYAHAERAVETDVYVEQTGGARADRRGDEVQRHEHADALGPVLDAGDVGHVGRDADHAAYPGTGERGHQALGDGGHGGRPMPVVHVQHVEQVRQHLAGDRDEHERPATASVRVAPRARKQNEHQRHRVLDAQFPRLDLGHQILRVVLVRALLPQIGRLASGVQVAALSKYQVRAHLQPPHRHTHTHTCVFVLFLRL